MKWYRFMFTVDDRYWNIWARGADVDHARSKGVTNSRFTMFIMPALHPDVDVLEAMLFVGVYDAIPEEVLATARGERAEVEYDFASDELKHWSRIIPTQTFICE